MNKKIAVIMPTRSAGGIRNIPAQEAFASWKATTEGMSDFYYGVDFDDEHNYNIPEGALVLRNERLRLVPKLNKMCEALVDKYDYVYFLGDDHRFLTPGWESAWIADAEAAGGNAIYYGNDLLQKEALPTAVFMSTWIIKELGYMAPPCLQHMYADNFWKDLGKALSILRYYKDLIIEHKHHSARKSKVDSQYKEVAGLMDTDGRQYRKYLKAQFNLDVDMLRKKCALRLLGAGSTDV